MVAEAEEAQQQNLGPMMICTRLAGRAIIRVVGRCNEAQENSNLGKGCFFVVLWMCEFDKDGGFEPRKIKLFFFYNVM